MKHSLQRNRKIFDKDLHRAELIFGHDTSTLRHPFVQKMNREICSAIFFCFSNNHSNFLIQLYANIVVLLNKLQIVLYLQKTDIK